LLYALRDVVSSEGNTFCILTRRRMPLIPPEFLSCSVYMYRDVEGAANGVNCAGSAFLFVYVSNVQPEVRYLYVVTNRHVVRQGRGVVPRLTTVDGNTEYFPLTVDDWIIDEQGDDIAIASLGPVSPPYRFTGVPNEFILTRERASRLHVGPGDEVFMVGRFSENDGEQRNSPSVRFGNISMMPTDSISHDGNLQYSFLVEARSISGYSGSPVFMHIPPANWRPDQSERTGVWSHCLLGVDCGHIFREAQVEDKKTRQPVDPDWRVKFNTGMMVVVPSWVLGEWLDRDPFASLRKKHEERLAQEKAARPSTETDSTSEPDKANS
jgi:hypothetical protein